MKSRVLPIAILSIPFLYVVYLLAIHGNAFYTIHDNLDSEVTFRTTLVDANIVYSRSNDTMVPTIMRDLPRNAVNASSQHIISHLFSTFSPLRAYQINEILVRLIGLLGAFLFCLRIIFDTQIPNRNLYSALIAVSFSMTQAYMLYGLSVYGIPLLLVVWQYAYQHQNKYFKYIIPSVVTFIFTIYSSLVLLGYALLIILGVLFIYLHIKKNENRNFIGIQIIAMTLGYVYSELNLINLFLFNKDFVSHRHEFQVFSSPFCRDAITLPGIFLKTLIFGHYHSPYIALIPILLGVYVARKKTIQNKQILLALLLIGSVLAVVHTFHFARLFAHLKLIFPILQIFMIERFFFLFPIIWSIVLAYSVRQLVIIEKKKTVLMTIILTANLVLNVGSNTEVRANVRRIIFPPRGSELVYEPALLKTFPKIGRFFESKPIATWNGFYLTAMMEQIHRDYPAIRTKGKVVNLGIFPSVAQFNGYHTLDSYQNNYSLAYKQEFREVIAPELALAPKYQEYFDGFGSRCYLMSHELHDLGYFKTQLKGYYLYNTLLELNQLKISTVKLKQLGGTHIFSALKINNASEIGIRHLKTYDSAMDPIKIFLYEIL